MNAAQRAASTWGTDAPEWITALAEACDAHSLRKVATMLKVSPALLSLTLRNRQRGTDLLEGRVKSQIMIVLLACPVLGLIDVKTCRAEQQQSLITTNSARVALYRACHNGCLHYRGEKK